MGETTMDAEAGEFVYASAEAMTDFAQAVLAANGLPAADARVMAECLVKADLRGVDTHGVARLPIYLDRLRRGLVNARPSFRPQRVTPVAAVLDAQNAFGFLAGLAAIREAVAIAQELGLGVVAVKHSTHFGMAATYVLEALEAGMIALVFSNASRAMPPWGGREALLGTSPLAAGAPAGAGGTAFLLDMSPAVAARGKIRRALKRGESIPPGYALDAEGRPTTDPERALQGGVVLPIGGPKGSGLSMLMDIFGGVLSGAAYGGDVGDQYKQARPQDVGHFFLAMKPDLFVPLPDYKARMDTLIARVRACPPAAGFTEVLIAGEPELRHEAERRRRGIPYNRNEIADLQREAEQVGVAPPRVRNAPLAG
jgi:LDH2 family malate/lactate/ureidoglycolate dehydrogenase